MKLNIIYTIVLAITFIAYANEYHTRPNELSSNDTIVSKSDLKQLHDVVNTPCNFEKYVDESHDSILAKEIQDTVTNFMVRRLTQLTTDIKGNINKKDLIRVIKTFKITLKYN